MFSSVNLQPRRAAIVFDDDEEAVVKNVNSHLVGSCAMMDTSPRQVGNS